MPTVKIKKPSRRVTIVRIHMFEAAKQATLQGKPRVASALRYLADPARERFKTHLMGLIRARQLAAKTSKK